MIGTILILPYISVYSKSYYTKDAFTPVVLFIWSGTRGKNDSVVFKFWSGSCSCWLFTTKRRKHEVIQTER